VTFKRDVPCVPCSVLCLLNFPLSLLGHGGIGWREPDFVLRLRFDCKLTKNDLLVNYFFKLFEKYFQYID
jgi:hypothetical protein